MFELLFPFELVGVKDETKRDEGVVVFNGEYSFPPSLPLVNTPFAQSSRVSIGYICMAMGVYVFNEVLEALLAVSSWWV